MIEDNEETKTTIGTIELGHVPMDDVEHACKLVTELFMINNVSLSVGYLSMISLLINIHKTMGIPLKKMDQILRFVNDLD